MFNLFKNKKEWKTPGGTIPAYLDSLTSEPHLLIGGTTGSGKSVLINNVIYSLLLKTPNAARLILLDPKGCELIDYKQAPHTIAHASSVGECVQELNKAAALMDARFKKMKREGLKKSTAPDVYIIIDEWIDLKTQAGKLAELPALRIIAKGRAANIHIILATQRPTREIITGAIRANFPAVVALRCNNAQESRNLIQTADAELLPLYGQALYKTPKAREPIMLNIEQIALEEIRRVLNHWNQ